MIGDQEGEDDYHFDHYTDEGRLMLQYATRVAVFFVKPMKKVLWMLSRGLIKIPMFRLAAHNQLGILWCQRDDMVKVMITWQAGE